MEPAADVKKRRSEFQYTARDLIRLYHPQSGVRLGGLNPITNLNLLRARLNTTRQKRRVTIQILSGLSRKHKHQLHNLRHPLPISSSKARKSLIENARDLHCFYYYSFCEYSVSLQRIDKVIRIMEALEKLYARIGRLDHPVIQKTYNVSLDEHSV